MDRKLCSMLVFDLLFVTLLTSCGQKEATRVVEKRIEVTRVVEKQIPVTQVIEKEVVKEVPVTRVIEKEVVKEVPVTRVIEKVVKEAETGEQESFVLLPALAQKLRQGEIDVGQEYGMMPGQRFHNIHAKTIGMQCGQCHVAEAPLELATPSPYAPAPVDRRICLGCHMNGPATTFYSAKE